MAEREGAGAFDAFDPDTWRFEPTPVPWYRSRQAMTAGIAVAAASAAIVVSGVLLVFDGSGAAGTDEPATTAVPVAPGTATSTPAATSVEPAAPPPSPPAAPPPPPAAEITAEPIVTTPATAEEPPSTRPTKEPEFGVTRTQETRRPISVAPNRPG